MSTISPVRPRKRTFQCLRVYECAPQLSSRFLDSLFFVGSLNGAEMFSATTDDIDAPARHLIDSPAWCSAWNNASCRFALFRSF